MQNEINKQCKNCGNYKKFKDVDFYGYCMRFESQVNFCDVCKFWKCLLPADDDKRQKLLIDSLNQTIKNIETIKDIIEQDYNLK